MRVLWRISASTLTTEAVFVCSFPVVSLALASELFWPQNELGSVSSLLVFWRTLRRVVLILKCLLEFTCEGTFSLLGDFRLLTQSC